MSGLDNTEILFVETWDVEKKCWKPSIILGKENVKKYCDENKLSESGMHKDFNHYFEIKNAHEEIYSKKGKKEFD